MWAFIKWFLVNYFSPVFFILRICNLILAALFFGMSAGVPFALVISIFFLINGLRPWKVGMTVGAAEALVKHKYHSFIDKANKRYGDD